jgi:hypothetical protein
MHYLQYKELGQRQVTERRHASADDGFLVSVKMTKKCFALTSCPYILGRNEAPKPGLRSN